MIQIDSFPALPVPLVGDGVPTRRLAVSSDLNPDPVFSTTFFAEMSPIKEEIAFLLNSDQRESAAEAVSPEGAGKGGVHAALEPGSFDASAVRPAVEVQWADAMKLPGMIEPKVDGETIQSPLPSRHVAPKFTLIVPATGVGDGLTEGHGGSATLDEVKLGRLTDAEVGNRGQQRPEKADFIEPNSRATDRISSEKSKEPTGPRAIVDATPDRSAEGVARDPRTDERRSAIIFAAPKPVLAKAAPLERDSPQPLLLEGTSDGETRDEGIRRGGIGGNAQPKGLSDQRQVRSRSEPILTADISRTAQARAVDPVEIAIAYRTRKVPTEREMTLSLQSPPAAPAGEAPRSMIASSPASADKVQFDAFDTKPHRAAPIGSQEAMKVLLPANGGSLDAETVRQTPAWSKSQGGEDGKTPVPVVSANSGTKVAEHSAFILSPTFKSNAQSFGEKVLSQPQPSEPAESSQIAPEPSEVRHRTPQISATPQAVAKTIPQILDAITRVAPGEVDVALRPEELGQVRLRMVTSEGGMAVYVTAERPDTQDLIRRSIDLLQQDLRDAGFEDVTFHFADRREPSGLEASDRPEVDDLHVMEDMAVPIAEGTASAMKRLDIRI